MNNNNDHYFVQYVLECHGPASDDDSFNEPVTAERIGAVVHRLRAAGMPDFNATDSVDREWVRDVMLADEGRWPVNQLEHWWFVATLRHREAMRRLADDIATGSLAPRLIEAMSSEAGLWVTDDGDREWCRNIGADVRGEGSLVWFEAQIERPDNATRLYGTRTTIPGEGAFRAASVTHFDAEHTCVVPEPAEVAGARLDAFFATADTRWGIEPMHHRDGRMVTHPDGPAILLTDGDRFDVELGVYNTEGFSGNGDGEALQCLTLVHATHAADIIESLVTLQPEGTDWYSWASQWMRDNFAGLESPV